MDYFGCIGHILLNLSKFEKHILKIMENYLKHVKKAYSKYK